MTAGRYVRYNEFMPQTDNVGFNLTKATRIGRLFVKFGIIVFGLMMVGRISLQAFTAYWVATHPPPPPPPAMAFGLLPNIDFPDEDELTLPKSYQLETETGSLPEFGDRAYVYFMPQKAASLLDADNAIQIAQKYGFTNNPESIDPRTYRWRKQSPLQSVLELNIVTNNFVYKTDYLSRPELILDVEIPVEFEAVSQVKAFLNTTQLLPADVATASGKVKFLKAIAGDLTPAVSPSDADFVQVDINRAPLEDQFEVFTADAETGSVHAILSGQGGNSSIVHFEFQYFPVDYLTSSTYPLRSVTEAWRLLQAGEGYVARPASRNTDLAIIRKVALGYYESFVYQDYLQPIYVFFGDDDFVAYVPALTANSTESVQ